MMLDQFLKELADRSVESLEDGTNFKNTPVLIRYESTGRELVPKRIHVDHTNHVLVITVMPGVVV